MERLLLQRPLPHVNGVMRVCRRYLYHVAIFSEFSEDVAFFESECEEVRVSNSCRWQWDNLQRSRGGNFGSAAYSVGRRGVCNRYAAFTCVEGEASMKCRWNRPPGT